MDSVKMQHNAIKKAQTKEYVTLSLSGLFSYPSRYIPSRKRDSGCTNILHTGTLPSVRGEGQRLRKGFQGGGTRKVHIKLGDQSNRVLIALRHKRPSDLQMMTVSGNLESLSSAAEIRHSGRIRGYEESPLPCLYS